MPRPAGVNELKSHTLPSAICMWWPHEGITQHYNDAIMSAMASQITSLTIVYSTVCSGAGQRKHQSSPSLAFVRGIHRWPVNCLHKGPVTRKCFHLMPSSWSPAIFRAVSPIISTKSDHLTQIRNLQVEQLNWMLTSLILFWTLSPDGLGHLQTQWWPSSGPFETGKQNFNC